jgi:hypothetical protein
MRHYFSLIFDITKEKYYGYAAIFIMKNTAMVPFRQRRKVVTLTMTAGDSRGESQKGNKRVFV